LLITPEGAALVPRPDINTSGEEMGDRKKGKDVGMRKLGSRDEMVKKGSWFTAS